MINGNSFRAEISAHSCLEPPTLYTKHIISYLRETCSPQHVFGYNNPGVFLLHEGVMMTWGKVSARRAMQARDLDQQQTDITN